MATGLAAFSILSKVVFDVAAILSTSKANLTKLFNAVFTDAPAQMRQRIDAPSVFQPSLTFEARRV
jgi:hypothetical protein